MPRLIGKIINQDETSNDKSYVYAIFRTVVALLFMQHGAQKLLGDFGGVDGAGATVEFFSLLWFAGVIELFGGGLIVLGLFTRLAAILAVVSMAYAYFIVHLPAGFFPIINRGELALIYLASFLLILKNGTGRFSLEKAIFKKEIF